MSETVLWDEFPTLYHSLLPTWFKRSYQPEALATCDQCAMCPAQQPKVAVKTYQPHLKCCTFYPDLPNYLVGALLSDTDPAMDEGRRRVRLLIQQRSGVSPYGVNATPLREFLYARSRNSAFGKSETLLCPYFHRENHNCTIWRYRNAVCATFFCKFNDGAAGHRFWAGVKEYLSFVQALLSEYALDRLGFNLENLPDNPLRSSPMEGDVKLSAEELDGRVSDATWKKLWGEQEGHEEAFFVRCFQEVTKLGPDDLASLGGFEHRRRFAKVTSAKLAVDYPPLPATMQRNPKIQIHEENESQVVVEGFNGLTAMPMLLWRFVQQCNGAETAHTIAAFEEEHGLEIDQDLIINLVHNRFLLADDVVD